MKFGGKFFFNFLPLGGRDQGEKNRNFNNFSKSFDFLYLEIFGYGEMNPEEFFDFEGRKN